MDLSAGPGLGAACALASALTWAVTSLLVRTLAPALSSVKVNALRSTAAGVLLLGWVVLGGRGADLLAISAAHFLLLALSIVAAVNVGDTVFFESTRALGLARAMTVSMTYPLIATALAAAFFGEPVTVPQLAGAVLTLGGIVLIVATRRETPGAGERLWFGLGTATLASVAWAVSTIMMKPPLREIDPLVAQAIRLPVAAVLLWLTPWTWGALADLRVAGGPARRRLAVLSAVTAASSVLFVTALKYADVVVATVLSSTAPMFALPLGWLVLGERVSPGAVLGTLMTVAGIVVLQL